MRKLSRAGSILSVLFLCVALASVILYLFRSSILVEVVYPPREFSGSVARVNSVGDGLLAIPKEAVAGPVGGDMRGYILRIEMLRARKIYVLPAGFQDNLLLVESDSLKAGDLVLLNPASFEEESAIAVSGGLSDMEVIKLTLEAGIGAAERRDVTESARFISPLYNDPWGFDFKLMVNLLLRAYKEFENTRVEVVGPPDISIEGKDAFIRADIKVQADYSGRRNYLIGGPMLANQVLVRMQKLDSGWKIAELQGLKPLGFEEKFLRLLGAEVGLPLSGPEKAEKKEACMPCRRAMADRFGQGR